MIDVSEKPTTLRTATAAGRITVGTGTIRRIAEGNMPKGNPLEAGKVAAVQAVKNTPGIIPYCHPLPLDFVGVEFATGTGWIDVHVTVKAIARTGVEMEAMTGVAAALLTVYDMAKMIDDGMRIERIELIRKTGGKSDFAGPVDRTIRAAVLVMSDSAAAGTRKDTSGEALAERLRAAGVEVTGVTILPDEAGAITDAARRCADVLRLDFVVTTGGTGLGPRDVTPEALRPLLDRDAPGIVEAVRAYGQQRTPFAMLSRSIAGVRGNTLFLSLPGSTLAVNEAMGAVFPALLHALRMIQGEGHELQAKRL